MQTTIMHTIGDREVAIKELTVGEIRMLLAAQAAEEAAEASEDGGGAAASDVVGEIICKVSFSDLVVMTDLNSNDLDAFTPSQINELAERCIEVNRAFFDMARKIKNTVAFLNQQQKRP